VNTQGNIWRCLSESCNANNGAKRGGDAIKFVALMEGVSQLDAAKKLAEMFQIGHEKAPAYIEKGPVSPIEKPDERSLDNTPRSESVKYMQEVEVWFDSIILCGDQETDEQYRKRVLNAIKTGLHESYKNGQKSRAA
jgi:hypothetical protein